MSRSIGEAFADDALERQLCEVNVVDAEPDAEAIPEIELGKVAMQMLLATVLVDAAHPALKDREEVFEGVGVRIAAHPSALWLTDSCPAKCRPMRG